MMGCVCGKEDLEIGGRKFEILKQIGEGGFSIVYLVQERGVSSKIGRFAVKKITCHSEAEVERTKTEIQLHEKLGNHSNILSIEASSFEKNSSHQAVVYQREDSLTDSSDAYLVFPFYSRGTLLEELAKRGARSHHYPENTALHLFLGIAKAVAAFHNLTPIPYAHRDIKVANILLADDDTPILMDFGSARPARVKIQSNREASTLQDEAAEHSTMTYRPPELFNVEAGSQIDERTDIWSLGCLLFALCFFVSPFDSAHERGDSVALAVTSGKIAFPENSPFTPKLHSFITRLVDVEISSRPQIDEVISITEDLIKNLPRIPDAKIV